MRFVHAIAALALLTCAGASYAAPANGEAELAKAIAGRVPGKPQHCIFLPQIRNTQIIDQTAIIYDMGSTIYVNRPQGGAKFLSDWDVLVTHPTGSELCNLDIVRLYDRGSHFQKGFINLGDFVPYKRVQGARH